MKQGWDELIHTCIHTSILMHTCACTYIPLSLADRDKHWDYKMPTYCDDHIRTYAHSDVLCIHDADSLDLGSIQSDIN